MDNYSLNDVKNLNDNNLLTSDILKTILESTTRRIELYQDIDDINILKYLLKSNLVPNKTKEEIKKYLSEYEDIVVENYMKSQENISVRRKNVITLIVVLFVLIIICCIVVKII